MPSAHVGRGAEGSVALPTSEHFTASGAQRARSHRFKSWPYSQADTNSLKRSMKADAKLRDDTDGRDNPLGCLSAAARESGEGEYRVGRLLSAPLTIRANGKRRRRRSEQQGGRRFRNRYSPRIGWRDIKEYERHHAENQAHCMTHDRPPLKQLATRPEKWRSWCKVRSRPLIREICSENRRERTADHSKSRLQAHFLATAATTCERCWMGDVAMCQTAR